MMSANDPKPATTPATTTTLAPQATPNVATAKPAQSIDLAKLVGKELDAEALSALERDMQLKHPSEVTLPDGRKLQDLIDAQTIAQREETKEARKTAKLPDHSSTVMTTKTLVGATEHGQVVRIPLSPPPGEKTEPDNESLNKR